MIKRVEYIEMYSKCVTTVRRLVDVCLCATHGENLIWPDGQAIRLFHLSDANNDDMLTMTELQHIFADFDNNSRKMAPRLNLLLFFRYNVGFTPSEWTCIEIETSVCQFVYPENNFK